MIKPIKFFQFFFLLATSFAITTVPFHRVVAQGESIPSEIFTIVPQLDVAFNNRDTELIERYISPDFTSKDGLNYQSFSDSMNFVWEKYPDLKYETTIESGKKEGNRLIAITTTKITGSYIINDRQFQLNSTIKAEQTFENNQLIKQKILQERNEITSGEKPPVVTFDIPKKARPGQVFDFDVIIKEPIGTDLVLGAALEEKITGDLLANPSSLELEALTAGGIFKRVTVPSVVNDQWYSIILIRDGGIRMITQRLIVNRG